MKNNLIVQMSYEFSLEIIKFTEELEHRKKFSMSNQLFRSGTSIGANIREAQGAESRRDFIHKLKISDKEVQETEYWLMLCRDSANYPKPDELLIKLGHIKRVLGKILSSLYKQAA